MIEAFMQASYSASESTGVRLVPARSVVFRSFFLVAAILAALFLSVAKAVAQPAQSDVALDVVYIPTPQSLVERMLEIAEVKPGELVMDLGCGDGRMVVTAANKFGARGVGVDIDPVRINEARENARRAGVADKVELRIGDLFEVDISKADVLAIYLLNEINERLRPKILATMKPGSRVVSHAFHMGDWKPDELRTFVEGQVYFWVVPAQVRGRWQVRQGANRFDLALDQKYQYFTGNATIDGRSVPVREGRINGTEISYVIEDRPGQSRSYTGRINGDRIESVGSGQPAWQAVRRSL